MDYTKHSDGDIRIIIEAHETIIENARQVVRTAQKELARRKGWTIDGFLDSLDYRQRRELKDKLEASGVNSKTNSNY